MRIFVFSLAYHPFVGGAEIALQEIIKRLPNYSFEIITVNLDGKQVTFENNGNVKIHRLGKGKLSKYFFPFTAYRFATKLSQAKQCDLIWSIMANQAGLAGYFFKIKHKTIPALLTLQEGDSSKKIWSRTFLFRPLYKRIYRLADHVQAISGFLAKRAKSFGYQGEVTVVPNGVDISLFTKNVLYDELVSIRRELGLNSKTKVIITVSRLTHKNGIDVLIRAMKNLNAVLLVVGGGELESDLKSLAKEIDVSEKVIFMGQQPYAKLPKYLKLADVFARPSRSEGLGSAFLEAMAAGVPVVATEVGGIVDIVKDNQTGLFAKVDDPQDVSKKIEQLLNDGDLADRLRYNGRELAVLNYDWDNVSNKMEKIIKKLVDNQ